MSAEAEDESRQRYSLPPMADSEESEEEISHEEPPTTSWSDLSIIERVGLNSVEMSEKDIETTFSQIALAFRCDQYTLKQRLQAEEHARNLAEENVQLELTRGRETLEMLKGLCLDSKRSKILQKLELSLDILGGTVERISNTAEVLGAVHQEARVSRAVELMVAHVESLRRRYDRNAAELEEAKKTLQQQNMSRNLDLINSSDQEENEMKRRSSQSNLRRRVSISLIPSQSQEKKKPEPKNQASPMKKSLSFCLLQNAESSAAAAAAAAAGDDGNSTDDRPADPDPDEPPPLPPPPEAPAAPPEQPPTPEPEWPPPKAAAAAKTTNKNSSLDTLRQRHRNKSSLSKRKEKKATNIYKRISSSTCVPLWRRPRLLLRWAHRCRWTYLLLLFCFLSLVFLLWKFLDAASET